MDEKADSDKAGKDNREPACREPFVSTELERGQTESQVSIIDRAPVPNSLMNA